jgi:hypothetical protein
MLLVMPSTLVSSPELRLNAVPAASAASAGAGRRSEVASGQYRVAGGEHEKDE